MTFSCDCAEACRLEDWSDQFQPATRELLVFTKSAKRFFDLDAVRTEHSRTNFGNLTPNKVTGSRNDDGKSYYTDSNPAGAPPLDWWLIPHTEPYPFPQQGEPMTATFYVGDAIKVMDRLPEKSVDLILTSPPFLALRSYLPADHPDKKLEGGSQSTPGEYIDWLLDVVEACTRVLAPHGSLVFELGDTYSGSGGGGGDYLEGGWREGQAQFAGSAASMKESNAAHWRQKNTLKDAWPLAKSLSLIPETFRFAMVYGHNPHTGRTTAPWRLRNVIRWVRPNPPVGALCVDDQTEALTLDGWKRHDQLRDGDLIASYDLKTDSIRFLPATFVRYEREGESMVVIDKKATSQWLTEWHRCLTRTHKGGIQVRLAQDLTNDCDTLLCAPFEDVAGPSPVTTERAALLGWFVAEGSPHSRQARIVQSVNANPEKVARIRELLDRDGADYRETEYRRTSGAYGGAVMATFHIKGELAEWLNLHHKRLPMSYVTTWPEAQAQALFDALIDGDGHRRKSRGVLFHQKDEAIADAVQVLAIRLGYRASKSWQPSMGLWQITMSMAPIKDRRWTKIRKWEGEGIRREVYTGVVWCPQVETGFWLARRIGKTFITGNSDKFRPATSELMVFCKSKDRYFDLDAVREPFSPASVQRATSLAPGHVGRGGDMRNDYAGIETPYQLTQSGAPPLDWWNIPPGGYAGAHYAVWPPELLIKPIKAMCPVKVCRTCGEPSRRIVATQPELTGQRFLADEIASRRTEAGVSRAEMVAWFPHYKNGESVMAQVSNWELAKNVPSPGDWEILKERLGVSDTFDELVNSDRRWTESEVTYNHVSDYPSGNTQDSTGRVYQRLASRKDRIPPSGFSDCGHDDWRPGVVLDPFAGSGTTLAVATGHGRDAIGIDLDERNYDLALDRVGPFILTRGEIAA